MNDRYRYCWDLAMPTGAGGATMVHPRRSLPTEGGREWWGIPPSWTERLRSPRGVLTLEPRFGLPIILGLSLLLLGGVFLIDLLDDLGLPPFTLLPAAPYAISILIAAYFLPPRAVVAISACAVGAQLLVAWNHQSPWWSVALEQLGLMFIGYLAAALGVKTGRERTLKAEAEDSLMKLQAVVESMAEGVVISDAGGRILSVNMAALRVFGVRCVGEVLGESFAEFAARLDPRFLNGRPVPAGEWPMDPLFPDLAVTDREARFHKPEGNGTWIGRYSFRRVRNRAGQPILCVLTVRDVTAEKAGEEALRESMEQRQALAVLAERARLARELHDSLGQVLGYVNIEAQAATKQLSRGNVAEVETSLNRMVAAAREADADIREYIASVRGAGPGENGFFPAVEQQMQRYSRGHGIMAELEVSPEIPPTPFAPAVEVQLLRIVQEALTNVRKHARAERVKVAFTLRDGAVRIAIEDDGRGFDPEQHPDRDIRNFGLLIMRERAEDVGGSLEFQSAPGHGTRVVVTVPLRVEEKRLQTCECC